MAMSAADRRALYRKQSESRHKESYSSRDDSGQYKDYYEPSNKAKVKFWKPKEGEHDIIILPTITGSQHPKYKSNESTHYMEVFIHRQMGINKDSVVCLNRTYGERCPICDYLATLDNPDTATYSAYAPTKRILYNVLVLDNPTEESKGAQVWDVSSKLFSKPLEDFAHKKREGGEVKYADIDDGKVINFVQSGTKLTLEFNSFEFKKRRELTDEELESAVILDELCHKPEFEEVERLLTAQLEARGEANKPSNKSSEESSKFSEKKEETRNKESDVPSPKMPESDLDCPYGAVFGTDFSVYEECKGCEKKPSCKEKKDKLEAETKPTEKKRLTRRER